MMSVFREIHSSLGRRESSTNILHTASGWQHWTYLWKTLNETRARKADDVTVPMHDEGGRWGRVSQSLMRQVILPLKRPGLLPIFHWNSCWRLLLEKFISGWRQSLVNTGRCDDGIAMLIRRTRRTTRSGKQLGVVVQMERIT